MLVDPVRDLTRLEAAAGRLGESFIRRVLRGDSSLGYLLYGTTLGYRARLQPNRVMHIARDVSGTGAGFRLCLSLPCTSAGGMVE